MSSFEALDRNDFSPRAEKSTGGLDPHAPGSTPANSAVAATPPLSGLRRAVDALRRVLPIAQRILPLLDGNIPTVLSHLLSPPFAPPPPTVNLAPIETRLTALQAQHRELRNQVQEQNATLKRVENQLEVVREATERNTQEQQELFEDLKSVGNKVNLFALVAVTLLAISIILNAVLLLHILRVLP
jgi:hypothetical protein